jgi:hypothetical protein
MPRWVCNLRLFRVLLSMTPKHLVSICVIVENQSRYVAGRIISLRMRVSNRNRSSLKVRSSLTLHAQVSAMRKLILFFGPERTTPSWRWVGRDIAAYLSSTMDVRIFQDESELPHHATVFWIKEPPQQATVESLERKRMLIIFFPIDAFHSAAEIEAAGDFLGLCRLIVVHSPSLAPFFDRAKVGHVDHYNKYGIVPAMQRPGTELLWIGSFQYAPYVFRFLLQAPPPARMSVVMLSDAHNPNAVRVAQRLALEIGLGSGFGPHSIAGYARLEEWSEARHTRLLRDCQGAFDIKDASNLNQLHKPPTKLQKFLCSGIPTAVSPCLPLLDSVSITIPDPVTTERWLSAEYRMSVQREGERLRPTLTLATDARRYLGFAAELQTNAPAIPRDAIPYELDCQ